MPRNCISPIIIRHGDFVVNVNDTSMLLEVLRGLSAGTLSKSNCHPVHSICSEISQFIFDAKCELAAALGYDESLHNLLRSSKQQGFLTHDLANQIQRLDNCYRELRHLTPEKLSKLHQALHNQVTSVSLWKDTNHIVPAPAHRVDATNQFVQKHVGTKRKLYLDELVENKRPSDLQDDDVFSNDPWKECSLKSVPKHTACQAVWSAAWKDYLPDFGKGRRTKGADLEEAMPTEVCVRAAEQAEDTVNHAEKAHVCIDGNLGFKAHFKDNDGSTLESSQGAIQTLPENSLLSEDDALSEPDDELMDRINAECANAHMLAASVCSDVGQDDLFLDHQSVLRKQVSFIDAIDGPTAKPNADSGIVSEVLAPVSTINMDTNINGKLTLCVSGPICSTNGNYVSIGIRCGRVLMQSCTGHYIFYEDGTANQRGWYIGPSLNATDGIVYHPSLAASTPPSTSWDNCHTGVLEPSFSIDVLRPASNEGSQSAKPAFDEFSSSSPRCDSHFLLRFGAWLHCQKCSYKEHYDPGGKHMKTPDMEQGESWDDMGAR